MTARKYSCPATLLAALGLSGQALAYDLNDRLSIGGLMAGAVHCQELSHAGTNAGCRGGLPVQPEVNFQATDSDQFYLKLGFGVGNGLNAVSPFLNPVWAADLEDDVKQINGRDRDYLLTAWYKHTLTPSPGSRLGFTLGLIDAADYLDDNAYANDEFNQFLNGALVNGPQAFLPSYDYGGAVEWDAGPWSLRGVYMKVGENDDGNGFDFQGVQLGYRLQTGAGEGQYRLLLTRASADFVNPAGTDNEGRAAVSLSFDQQFGQFLGAFIRAGWQSDDAAVDFDAVYSGGIDVRGGAWGRGEDNIGLGVAYLSGGNLAVNESQVFEVYYRFVLNDLLALTADIQYMEDDLDGGDSPHGWIFGLRAVAEF